MTTPNHDLLIELLLTNELSPDQQRQLRELITVESVIEDEVFDQMWLEPLLRDSFESNPDAFVARIETALNDEDGDTTQFTQRVLDVWTERSVQQARKRVFAVGAVVALAIAVVLGILLYPPGAGRSVQAAPAVRVQNAIGTVEVFGTDGQSRRVGFGASIEPGDTIKTTGASSATVSWTEGSRVVLTRDASLTWLAHESRTVLLNSGLAHVVRAKSGAWDAVVFETKHARIEVPHSELLLATSDQRTDVTVRRGIAKLTDSNGKSVNVADGECGIATSKSLVVRKGTATPDTWNENFESGLSSGWQGHFVAKDLPEGSLGAIGTAPSISEDSEPCHQIWTYSDWQHGLAVVHEDTCLNFVYKLKAADQVQVLTLLRSPVPDSPVHDVQILLASEVPTTEQWWNIPSDEWYVVSIPLSRLSNPVSRKHPTEAFVATAFNFRPQNHACGLVIDRMWLDRGTSRQIQFKPLTAE